MFVRFFFLLVFVFPFTAWAHLTPFPVSYPRQTVVLRPGEETTVGITIEIPTGYFVYQEKTELEFINQAGLKIETIRYPASHVRPDPFFKKPMAVFEGEAKIGAVVSAPADLKPGKKIVEALLKFQGCSEVLCYPEESHLITFQLDIAAGGAAGDRAPAKSFSIGKLLSAQQFSTIFEHGFWVVLLVVFLGGVLTSLTPCVLPVIPITLMIIGVRSDRHWSHNFGLSVVLVLGLALMYAVLGIAAAALGKGLGFVFQQRGVLVTLAGMLFVLALSMFGLFDIHLPQFVRARLNQVKGHGLWGAFVSGAAAGILAAPCAGPVVGALLLYVAGTQSYLKGFGLLFWYALGIGLLFIVLGTGYGELEGRFRRLGFTRWVKRFLGLLLLTASVFYLNAVFPLQRIFDSRLVAPSSVVWLSSEAEGLQRAKAENKILLVDFYADWCAPCKELELGFFRKPEVVALLEGMVPVRIDATFVDDEVERVLKKYNVVGWPTVAFTAPDGRILEELTVVSYNPKVLLENMKRALAGP